MAEKIDRDLSIDILRGIAIFTMVCANTVASLLEHPHPLFIRIYGTFAAPLFVFLNGYLVYLNNQKRDHGFNYYLKRSILTLIVAALYDLSMGLIPFIGMDILYLTGISMPIVYLAQKIKPHFRLGLVFVIFILTFILQIIFGYTPYPTEIAFHDIPFENGSQIFGIFRNWILEGWFPIFPWLGFSLLGGTYYDLLGFKKAPDPTLFTCKLGLVSLIVGIILWIIYPGALYVRAGYSEMFYPPTPGFIITTIGVIFVLWSLFQKVAKNNIFDPLRVLGEAPLFFYFVHLTLINILNNFWDEEILVNFLLIYFGLILFLIFIGYGIRSLKKKWEKRPFIVKFLIG